MNYDGNKDFNRKLIISMQLINVFIGVIIALIGVVAYITIDDFYIRIIIIGLLLIFGIMCFINLYNKLHKEEIIEDLSNIKTIKLVNEENEIIKTWDIGERVAFVIGKSSDVSKVFVDLQDSIYSKYIEYNHAVLNYAAGKWYVEDLSDDSGVVIQKREDSKKYRIVKDSPCELKKGDIIFIHKVKLLLQ